MDIDADLASAFDEQSVDMSRPPANPQPTNTSSLMFVIRFLHAAATTSPGQSFPNVLSSTAPPSSGQQATAALQKVFSMNSSQLKSALSELTSAQQQTFADQVVLASRDAESLVTELSVAATLLRWLVQVGSPALPSAAAEAARSALTSTERMCKVIRPEEGSGADMQRAQLTIRDLEERLKAHAADNATLTAKLAVVSNGSFSANNSGDSGENNSRLIIIVLSVLFVLAVLLLIVFAVLYAVQRKKLKASSPALAAKKPVPSFPKAAPMKPSFGGIPDHPAPITATGWAFGDLMSPAPLPNFD